MPNGLKLLVSAAKYVGAVVAISYIIGFIIIGSWASRVGLAELSIIDVSLLAAGMLFVSINLVCGLGIIAWSGIAYARLDTSLKEKLPNIWKIMADDQFYNFSFILIALSIVIYVLFAFGLQKGLDYSFTLESVRHDKNLQKQWMAANIIALVLLMGGTWRFLFKGKGLIWPILGLLFFVFSLVLFGRSVYGIIPPALGGGAPTSVQLILKGEKESLLRMLAIPFINAAEFTRQEEYISSTGEEGSEKADHKNGLLLTDPVLLFPRYTERYMFCVSKCDTSTPQIIVLSKDELVGFVRVF